MIAAVVFLLLSKSVEAEGILKPRFGDGNLEWEQTVALASKNGTAEVLQKIFRSRPSEGGFYLATYRYDLFKVFRARPVFFLRTAQTHYKGNLDCVLFDLVTDEELVKFENLKKPLQQAAEAGGDAQIAKFHSAALARQTAIKNGQEPMMLQTKACYPR